MDIYIYYTIKDSDCDIAKRRVAELQHGLSDRYGINAQCKRRPEVRDDLQTWMEIYLNVPVGFEQSIEQAAAEIGLSDMAQNNRHIEHFMDLR